MRRHHSLSVASRPAVAAAAAGRAKRSRLQDADEDADARAEDEGDVVCEADRVYFYAAVSRRTVLKLMQCVGRATEYALKHGASPYESTVYVYVHSQGGDAYAGLSALDQLRTWSESKVHITTVLDGYVASAATFLLLGGSRRVAHKHGTILCHQLSTWFEGKYVDLVDELANSSSLMETVKTVYADHTHMSKKKIEALLSKEKNLDAAQCLRLGFVDELW